MRELREGSLRNLARSSLLYAISEGGLPSRELSHKVD